MTPREKKIEVNETPEGHYTNEEPYGPWSKALKTMEARAREARLASEDKLSNQHEQ